MENYSDLTGKTALVTGGSRGIGEGIVRGLVRQGAHVVLNYASGKERAEKIQKELGKDKCLIVGADVGDLKQLKQLWDEAVAWRGSLGLPISGRPATLASGVSLFVRAPARNVVELRQEVA